MATQYQLKPFVINVNDLVYLLAQVNFHPMFDALGNGVVDWDGVTQVFDGRGVAYDITGMTQQQAWDAYGHGFPQVSSPIGIRDVTGLHNNLFGSQADWGAVDVPFRRDIPADFSNYVTSPGANYATSVDGNGVVTQSSVIDYMPRIISSTITTAGVNLLKDSGGHFVEWNAARYASDNAYQMLVNTSGVDISQLVEGAKIVAPSNTEIALLDGNGDPVVWLLSNYQASMVYTATLATFSNLSFGGLFGSATGGALVDGGPIYYQPLPGNFVQIAGQTYQPDVLAYKQIIDGAGLNFATLVDGEAITTTVADSGYGLLEQLGHIDFQNPTSGEFFIGSENPGVAPVNSWFGIFGQFFDHGLDLIGKGGQGTKVTVALDPSDPLYRAPGTNGPGDQGNTAITISRATIDGADANGDPSYINHTSPFIDQSQTYGSADQITTLLREWVSTDGGATYHAGMELFDGQSLVDGWIQRTPVYNSATGLTDIVATEVHNTLPTLDELRSHVLATGRDALTWDDVLDLRNRDANGHVDGSGNSGHALLVDLNPHFDDATVAGGHMNQAKIEAAVRLVTGFETATVALAFTNNMLSSITIDNTAGGGVVEQLALFKTPAPNSMGLVDVTNFSIVGANSAAMQAAANEILLESVGDHYIAGDGRVNENFGLTSIHHVFHEEHNYQVENLKSWIYQHDANTSPTDHAGLYAWQVDTGVKDAFGNFIFANGDVAWDADKMFSATKLIVEMEYQHAAVDQYARTVTPRIQEFVGYSSGVDSTLSLEYSQVAFRFGHSTIRETIDTIDPDGWFMGAVTRYALEKAFLAPQTFAEEGVAAITLGLSRQQMNEVDEFITPALNQGLLGQPLDLAAINIARGRDLGIPTLNDFRAAISLAEYTSWDDFGKGMVHPESLANFIAAYSFGGGVDGVAKAEALVGLFDGSIAEGAQAALGYTASESVAFMLNNASGNVELDAARGGFDKIDSWIGGLAEAHVPGGLLGETFDAVFVAQIQSLMDGDRFYYLYRLFGTQIHEEVNNGQFKDIVERNTGLEHLNGSIFAYADAYYDFTRDADLNTAGAQDDVNAHAYATLTGAGTGLGIYSDGGTSTLNNGSVIDVGGQSYIRDVRPELDPTQVHTVEGTPTSGADAHEVIVGTDNKDFIHARSGDDTVYGEGGDDIIYGDGGVDRLYGGDGDDVIDTGEGPDLADGGAGKDIIYGRGSGSEVGGFDQLVGGSGNDLIIGGEGIDKLSGGSGDDVIYGDGLTNPEMGNTDPFTHGGDGNDYIDGGASGDLLYGEEGDDLVIGGNDQDLIEGGVGDDIMRPGVPSQAINGGPDEVLGDDGYVNSGFDLIDFSDYTSAAPGVVADLATQTNPLVAIDGTTPFPAWFQIEGIIGSQNNDTFVGDSAGDATADVSLGGNWLIGGSGNDTFRGNGGDDLIVGGSVRLDTLIGKYTGQAGYLDNAENAYTGASNRATGDLDGTGLIDVVNATIAGTANDFSKHFVDMLRSQIFKDLVLGDNGVDGAADVVQFSGNRDDYSVTRLTFTDGAGVQQVAFKITDNGGLDGAGVARTVLDGTDIVTGVETFQFLDGSFNTLTLMNVAPAITTNGGAPLTLAAINENTAANTQVIQLAAADANVTNPADPLYPQTLQWSLAGGTAGLFQIDQTGQISFASAPNYEALAIAGQTQQVLTATVSDGFTSDQIQITVNIAN
ncbi:MAG: peroxidase family protein, partial [Hyphomicrobium sp.]